MPDITDLRKQLASAAADVMLRKRDQLPYQKQQALKIELERKVAAVCRTDAVDSLVSEVKRGQ